MEATEYELRKLSNKRIRSKAHNQKGSSVRSAFVRHSTDCPTLFFAAYKYDPVLDCHQFDPDAEDSQGFHFDEDGFNMNKTNMWTLLDNIRIAAAESQRMWGAGLLPAEAPLMYVVDCLLNSENIGKPVGPLRYPKPEGPELQAKVNWSRKGKFPEAYTAGGHKAERCKKGIKPIPYTGPLFYYWIESDVPGHDLRLGCDCIFCRVPLNHEKNQAGAKGPRNAKRASLVDEEKPEFKQLTEVASD